MTSQSSIKGSGLVHACYESVRCFGEKFALKCNDFRNTNVCPLTERPDADYKFPSEPNKETSIQVQNSYFVFPLPLCICIPVALESQERLKERSMCRTVNPGAMESGVALMHGSPPPAEVIRKASCGFSSWHSPRS